MNYDKLGVYCSVGDKGNGKSLDQANLALKMFRQYQRSKKRYPNMPTRMLLSNQKFSDEVEQEHLGVRLDYWSNVHRLKHCYRDNCYILDPESPFFVLNPTSPYYDRGFNLNKPDHPIHDSDIFWDEIGRDFPAGSWHDTPKWVKGLFSHCRKRGNRFFCNTQVFDDTDIAFKRQCDFVCPMKKLMGSRDISATMPPVGFVWGIVLKNMYKRAEFQNMNMDTQDEEKQEEIERAKVNWFPSMIWISKKLVSVYNTRAELPAYMADKFEEQILTCVRGKYCGKKDRHGNPHTVIRHIPI